MMKHPNIIKLHDLVETTKQIYIVMDLCEGGELFDLVCTAKRLDEENAKQIYSQIIDGIEYLAKIRVVHRDIKPENIMFDENMNVKIVDFGLSNTWKSGERLQTACGSPCYASPEMISGKPYHGTFTDLWSSGIVLYFMLCGHLPFEDKDTSSLYNKILDANNSISSILPEFLSEECKNLLTKILNTDPRRRYGIRQIRNHPWMKNVVNEDLLCAKSEIDIDNKSEANNNDLINYENVSKKLKTTKNVGEISKSFVNTLKAVNPIKESEVSLNKSYQCSPISSDEYSNFISCQFKNQFNEVNTKFSHSKRNDKCKLSNHLTLDIPKIPEVQAESLNTELPKISSNSRQTNNITINSNKDNSANLTANDSESTNVPKTSNDVSFTSQETKAFIKNLEKQDGRLRIRKSKQRRDNFRNSCVVSPDFTQLQPLSPYRESMVPENCRNRGKGKRITNRELDYDTTIQDLRCMDNRLDVSSPVVNTRYVQFQQTHQIPNTPIMQNRKLGKIKNARKRVSSIGCEIKENLKSHFKHNIKNKFLQNNANFVMYNYNGRRLNETIRMTCLNQPNLMPPNIVFPNGLVISYGKNCKIN